MLYSNVKLNATEVKADFGNFFRVTLGEYGRGRRAVNLACPNDFRISEKELLNDYSIGTTKSGKPRISKINDDNLYLMISSQWGYTRRGCGHIETNGEVLSKGNGADGDAGRIGQWDAYLIKALKGKDTFVKVTLAGTSGENHQYLIIRDNKVYFSKDDTLDEMLDALNVDSTLSDNLYKTNR